MTSGNMSVKNMILGGTAGAGLCVASPSLAGAMLGVGSLGPIPGGAFACAQGPALATSSWMALAQSFIMVNTVPGNVIAASAAAGAFLCSKL